MKEKLNSVGGAAAMVGLVAPWLYSLYLDIVEGTVIWFLIHFFVPPIGWIFGAFRIVQGLFL
ncbi:hypothetical protein PZ897_17605 [Hoeflea sp. YIM 152468]|uniref:hypothetical protein n=1 Tax=Hoeflea sp. YIM 152468 TaxID=3031759 RepID=UPI0023D9BB0B|nr:hypothetical protein [Hoeflea sp. YIM 152468]MDF1610000.1 hypothetical protein [Hoeflea sp. YIM 152468]